MNDIFETSVEDFLKSTPGAIRFLLNWKLGCVGCGFARFCTLDDVVKTYQIDDEKFLEEAKKLIVHPTLSRSSE
jgi:hypothetical protein